MSSQIRYRRRLNGLPNPSNLSWRLRLLTSPWLWVTVFLTALYGLLLYSSYLSVTADREYKGGKIPGISPDAISWATELALPTLIVWSLIFIFADRLKPMRLLLWYYALGWGAAVATWAAIILNTWAASRMEIKGDQDPTSGARAAIFIAPFVEEAMKASIVFLIAICLRYRLVSRLSGIVLAALSALGFAFVENILYYSRVIHFASHNADAGNLDAAVNRIVMLRGFFTSFGHPLFTAMTGIGIAVAVRTKSKTVRVLAPLLGYLVAVSLHMTFNATASLLPFNKQVIVYFSVGLPLIAGLLYYVWRQYRFRVQVISARLNEYVMFGWLKSKDIVGVATPWRRMRSVVLAFSRGRKCLVATWVAHRDLTELAFLRDAMVRGIIDETGQLQEKQLLERIADNRKVGILDPTGLRFLWPRLSKIRWPWRRRAENQPPGRIKSW